MTTRETGDRPPRFRRRGYPWPRGWDLFGRKESSSDLRALAPFAIELHDIIITKLGRYHAKDRSDIELITRIPGFRSEQLTKLYELARADLKTYRATEVGSIWLRTQLF